MPAASFLNISPTTRNGVFVLRKFSFLLILPTALLYGVNSFDFFDTLAGRYEYDIAAPFRHMGRLTGNPHWLQVRQNAERVAGCDLNRIYDVLVRSGALQPSDAVRLHELEVAVELENLFPIAENVQKVRPGDWIVSDTYYSEPELRRLIRAIGIDDSVVHVWASGADKHTGFFWRRKAREFRITQHLGDNWHADVEMARRFGIAACHFAHGVLNDHERKLAEAGFQDLAAFQRMLRLVIPPGVNRASWTCIHVADFCRSLISEEAEFSHFLEESWSWSTLELESEETFKQWLATTVAKYPNLRKSLQKWLAVTQFHQL